MVNWQKYIYTKTFLPYFILGVALTCNVPLVPLSVSFAILPSLALTASVILFFISVFNFPIIFSRMCKREKSTWLIAFVYLIISSALGVIIYSPPIEYTLWTLGIFSLWFFIFPWVFSEENRELVHALALGGLVGALFNSFAVIMDVMGYSPLLFFMTQIGFDVSVESIGPWGYLFSDQWFKVSGGSGLASYSRTVTGFLLAIATSMLFSVKCPRLCKIIMQLLLFTGILFTGSRLAFLAWLLVMIIGFRNDSIKQNLKVVLLYVFYVYGGFKIGFFTTTLQGPLFGINQTYLQAVDIRLGYQLTSLNQWYLDSLIQPIFGSGPGNSGYALGVGQHMYSAHGAFFQYISDTGIFGLFLSMIIVITVLKKYFRIYAVWGLTFAAGVSLYAEGIFFPKPQAPFIAILFVIFFVSIKNRYELTADEKSPQHVPLRTTNLEF